MIRLFYNLLFPLVLLFFLPGYLVKMLRRGNYREKFGERLGFYDRATRRTLSGGRRAWVHAVSVGEVMIALKLLATMKPREPALRVVLTTTTTTGFALARQRAPDWAEVLYTPLDFWPIMRRAFSVIRPLRIILVEAEIWPNMATIAQRRRIPLALVNARLSPRSERRFRRFRSFVRPYFQKLDLICVPEPQDAVRWQSLGARADRLHTVGSIKFDPENVAPQAEQPRALLATLGVDPSRPILLGGSTHRGEEEILGRILLALRREFPALFLLIAPRHVERVREIEEQLQASGLTTARWRDTAPAPAPDCLLLDTTGELRDWYPVATVVFIGKSLTTHGGPNPVEAIVADRPVVFGPHMENFDRLAAALVEAGGALQPGDEAALRKVLADLLRDPERRERLVERARTVLDQHRGATERTALLLAELAGRRA
ncbi:3-deoxy-D-manno-octulosonic acid transferase [soil metagenome]